MWLVVTYQPVGLFSLRDSDTTTSGGRSLILPTPYAVKMALLDVALRYLGEEKAESAFGWFRGLQARLRGPRHLVVNNTFIKVFRAPRGKGDESEEDGQNEGHESGENGAGEGPGLGPPAFARTVAFRQFIAMGGAFNVAFEVAPLSEEERDLLGWLLRRITYFGKRGGFVQLVSAERLESLPRGFGTPLDSSLQRLDEDFIIQQTDDMGREMSFQKALITGTQKVRLGKDRMITPVLHPYKVRRASRGYTWMERQTT